MSSDDAADDAAVDAPDDAAEQRTAGAFDIRTFIGSLLGFFGVVLTVTGLWFTDDAERAKVNGDNLNLQVGIALVVAALIFVGWALLRPVRVPVDVDRDAVEPRPH